MQLTPVSTSVSPTTAPLTMAPKSAVHGTTVSSYGQLSGRPGAFIGLAADAVTTGADANPGSPPREAPV
ncbi:MAG: hypothetical protein QOJ79_2629 [Actinomycetota bacterium]|nr:hypothetical protein [Actinomycetota bacterium]